MPEGWIPPRLRRPSWKNSCTTKVRILPRFCQLFCKQPKLVSPHLRAPFDLPGLQSREERLIGRAVRPDTITMFVLSPAAIHYQPEVLLLEIRLYFHRSLFWKGRPGAWIFRSIIFPPGRPFVILSRFSFCRAFSPRLYNLLSRMRNAAIRPYFGQKRLSCILDGIFATTQFKSLASISRPKCIISRASALHRVTLFAG